MLPTPFSFFTELRVMIHSAEATAFEVQKFEQVDFPIHPSASELSEQMLIDPEVLKNETYEPGIYDEDGDYYPQYSDDPSCLPESLAPNSLNSGDTAPESVPASDTQPSESPVPKSESD